jgi:hypothetical protein
MYDAGVYPDFAEVKEAFEATYPCLGITCAHVGALPGTTACISSPSMPPAPPSGPPPPPSQPPLSCGTGTTEVDNQCQIVCEEDRRQLMSEDEAGCSCGGGALPSAHELVSDFLTKHPHAAAMVGAKGELYSYVEQLVEQAFRQPASA